MMISKAVYKLVPNICERRIEAAVQLLLPFYCNCRWILIPMHPPFFFGINFDFFRAFGNGKLQTAIFN